MNKEHKKNIKDVRQFLKQDWEEYHNSGKFENDFKHLSKKEQERFKKLRR